MASAKWAIAAATQGARGLPSAAATATLQRRRDEEEIQGAAKAQRALRFGPPGEPKPHKCEREVSPCQTKRFASLCLSY
jgi:hypothetical protein